MLRGFSPSAAKLHRHIYIHSRYTHLITSTTPNICSQTKYTYTDTHIYLLKMDKFDQNQAQGLCFYQYFLIIQSTIYLNFVSLVNICY